MNAVLKHIEKIILGVALVTLLVCLWFFLQNLHGTTQRVRNLWENAIEVPEGNIPAISEAEFQGAALLDSPDLTWQPGAAKGPKTLFDPRKYIYCADAECPYILPYDADVCPHCGETQGRKVIVVVGDDDDQDRDGDGLPSEYEKQYAFLDDNVPSDADRDQDQDLFTNKEEFAAQTLPDDPGSHPPLIERTRFLAYQKRRLPLELYQVKTYGETNKSQWDLFITLGKGQRNQRTKIFTIGDDLLEERYTVMDAEYRTETVFDPTVKIERQVEMGIVTLKDNDTGATITLKQGEQALSTNLYVQFVYLTDPTSLENSRIFRAKVGEVIRLRDPAGNTESYRTHFLARQNAPALQPVDANGDPAGAMRPIPRFSPQSDLRRRPAPRSPVNNTPQGYDEGVPPPPVEF